MAKRTPQPSDTNPSRPKSQTTKPENGVLNSKNSPPSLGLKESSISAPKSEVEEIIQPPFRVKPDFAQARDLIGGRREGMEKRLRGFLDEMRVANEGLGEVGGFEILDEEGEGGDEEGESESGSDESDDSDESGEAGENEDMVIQMELGLGVLEEKRIGSDDDESSDSDGSEEVGVEDLLRRLKDVQGDKDGDNTHPRDGEPKGKKRIIEEIGST